MKKLMIIPLVFLLCFTFSCQQGEEVAEEPAVDVTADVEAIKTWYDQKTTALKTGDPDSWINLFTEDVVFMMPNEATVEGKEAVQQWGQPFFDLFDMEEVYKIEEIEVSDNWAFARVNYRFNVTPKTGGEVKQENGKGICMFKRQPDGSWKCTHNIANSSDPLPTTPDKE